MAIAAPCRRAHRDEDRIRTCHGLGQIKGERQPACGDVLGHQHIQPGLENRHLACLQPINLARIFIDADHLMPEIRKTHARDQAHIACSNHRNFHEATPKSVCTCLETLG